MGKTHSLGKENSTVNGGNLQTGFTLLSRNLFTKPQRVRLKHPKLVNVVPPYPLLPFITNFYYLINY